MKQLKKHPKQQRMEEMTFPIIKPNKNLNKFIAKALDGKKRLDLSGGVRKGKYTTRYKERVYISGGDESILIYNLPNEKVTMTGREYLRSINDDNGFTLMPRIVWRVVAVGVLVGAVIYCAALFL